MKFGGLCSVLLEHCLLELQLKIENDTVEAIDIFKNSRRFILIAPVHFLLLAAGKYRPKWMLKRRRTPLYLNIPVVSFIQLRILRDFSVISFGCFFEQ